MGSDFRVQENEVCHCLHCFPIYLPWSDGTRCQDFCFLNVEFFFLFLEIQAFIFFHHASKLTTIYTVSKQRNNCIITRVPNYQVRQLVIDYFWEVIFTEQSNNFQIIRYFQDQNYIMRPGHADNCNNHTKSPSYWWKKKKLLFWWKISSKHLIKDW